MCLSFGSELNTWPLLARLEAGRRKIWVPRAEPRDRSLHLHAYPCRLQALDFGLLQPRRGEPELADGAIDATIDVALLVGLAFDRRGFRLGHGKGYFDRFLAGRPFPAVGLAFDLQIVDRLPEEAHDVAMTAIVTESEVVALA